MQKCGCHTDIYCDVLRILTDGRNSRLWFHLSSCALARPRPAAAAEFRACGRGNAVTQLVWPRSLIEDSFASWVLRRVSADGVEWSWIFGQVDYRSDDVYQHAPSLLLGLRVWCRQKKPRRRPRRGGVAALQAMSLQTRRMRTDDERHD